MSQGIKKLITPVQFIDEIPKVEFDQSKMIDYMLQQRQYMMDDRNEWSRRQREYLAQWDDYVTYSREGLWDNSSNFHMPLTMQMIKTVHARFKQALFSVRPWWMVIPIERMDVNRISLIDTVMRWAVGNYCNYYKGIERAVDDWIWDFISVGWAVMKRRWEVIERSSIVTQEIPQMRKLENEERFKMMEAMANETGFSENPPEEIMETVAKEVKELVKYFDGPVIEPIAHDYILFPGEFADVSDLNMPKMICHDFTIEESQVQYYKESGYYDEAAAKKILEGGIEDSGGQSMDNTDADAKKQLQDIYQGVQTVNSSASSRIARMSEIHIRYDLDEDGIDEELIFTVNPKSRQIGRWTYLDRSTRTGKRPFHKIDFIRRPRRSYSLGLLEILYPLNEEIDAIHNMRMDFGTISNIPFFFFRPTSGMKGERIKLEPGMGYPLDNPQSDVNFPRFNNSTAWGMQEEMGLVNWAERLTSVSAMTAGMPQTPVGASRTATGMTALLNEANLNLDVMLGRLKDGYAELLVGILSDLQERMPNNTLVRVTGSDGEQLYDMKTGVAWFKNVNRFEIGGRVDFQITANSTNSNRELEKQNAIMLSQMLLNPINLQTGIVQPQNIYYIIKNVLDKYQAVGIDNLITKPENILPPMSLFDEIQMCRQGLMPTIVLNDNHQAKVVGLTMFVNEPSFMAGIQSGNNSPSSLEAFNKTIAIHTEMAAAIAAQANAANVSGLQISPTMGARMAGQVGETGRPLPEENLARGLPAKGGGPNNTNEQPPTEGANQ